MQDNVELIVNPRASGKHWSRGLRKNKQIPAVVYGPKIENLNFSISETDATRYNKSDFENTIFTLKSDNTNLNGLKVLKKEIVIHPMSRRPVHMDFYAVDMTSEVRVHIKVKYIGKPLGLMSGGVVQEIRHEVEVECLPNNIPEIIELDISKMQLGDVLHASDLILPANVELITSEEEALVSVTEPREEEPAAVEATATPAEGAVATAAPATEKKD
ncbi:MAG: 50S ribosomal protein L25 [Bdellovibrionaceae bacterium]|nr:50S ribosomal protein L25 [Pseudobdellovibrionaceae bacterium]